MTPQRADVIKIALLALIVVFSVLPIAYSSVCVQTDQGYSVCHEVL